MTIFVFFQTFLLSFLAPPSLVFNKTLAPIPRPLSAVFNGAADAPLSKVAVGKVNYPGDFAKNDYRIKTVVIDAGHGGHDPGCLGGSSQEKHIALAVSKRLGAAIEEQFPEVRVILTRDKDVFIPLHERAQIANRHSADLFISIHCNYFPNRESISGSETYVMGLHTAEHNLEVAKRENSVILLEDDYERNYDYDPNSPEGHIMLSMFQNAYLEHSILFAEKVESKISSDAERRSRGVKQAGFVVLKETAMPSVLIETGFLSNKQEERYLMTAEGQQRIAEAIVAAFGEYKRTVELLAGKDGTLQPLAQASPEPAPVGQQPSTTTGPAVAAASPASTPATKMTVAADQAPPMPDREKGSGTVVKTTSPAPPGSNNPPLSIYVSTDNTPPPANNTPEDTGTRPQPPSPTSTLGTAIPPSGTAPTPVATTPPAAKEPFPATAEKEKVAVFYCVQLAASPKPLDTSNNTKWQNIPYPVERLEEEGMFKYQARQFTSLQEASKARAALKERGFNDAFIVAYKGINRISITEAKSELGQ